MIDLDTFVQLSNNQIAQLVGEQDQQVCILPISGIQRWHSVEYGKTTTFSDPESYSENVTLKLLDLYRLCFDLGIHSLVSPLRSLAEDNSAPLDFRMRYLEALTTHSDFLCFYEKYSIRVHFYGGFERQLTNTPYAYLTEQLKRLAKHTRKNTAHRLFYGLYTDHAAENIADLSVRYFIRTGQIPSQRTMMELYYGEAIETTSLFIGCSTFNPTDYPLLNLAEKDLYFTAAPSFYLDNQQLRHILHAHLHPRQEPDTTQLTGEELAALKIFYQAQRTTSLGHLRPGAPLYAAFRPETIALLKK